MNLLCGSMALLVLQAVTEGVQVALDLSNLKDPRHLQAMEELSISTFLAVPTTTTFTLVMNQAAMRGMSHLLNGSVEAPESSQQQQQQQQEQNQRDKEQQQQHQRHKEQQQQQQEKQQQPQEKQQQQQQEKQQQQHQRAGKSLVSISTAPGLPGVDFRAQLASVEKSDLGVHLTGVEDMDLGAHMAGVDDSNLGDHLLGVEELEISRDGEDSDLGAHLPDVEGTGTHLADVKDPDREHHLGVEGSSLGVSLSGVEDSDSGAHLVDVEDSDLGALLSGVDGPVSGMHPAGGKDSDLGAHLPGVEDINLRTHVKDLDLHAHLPDMEDTDYGGVEDSELWACLAGLSKENADVVRALLRGEVAGPLLTLAPTDEEFPEALELLHSLRTCRWYPNSPLPQPKVEALEVDQMMSGEVEERLKELTSGEKVEAGRGASHTTAFPMQVDSQHLTHLLGSVFSITRNHETAPMDKLVATLYISRKFDSFGLMVVNHVFSAAEYFLWFDRPLQGTNVIGVLAGSNWGTAADEPLVLGAHLDTVPGTPGLDDDGSGLAALVEAARVLSSSGCVFTHTIFFVAFDLEEIGTQGSLVFVKDYLMAAIMDKFGTKQVTGAFILDCVSNWDPQPGTQEFPETWSNLLPEAGRSLSHHNYTGDFTALIYRTQVDAHLAHRLAQYYRGLEHPQYRLELLGLRALGADLPDMGVLKTHFDFLRSDHLRFWYQNDTGSSDTRSFNTIPAVLITDTGPYRGTMRQCYHGACDGPLVQSEDNLGLLAKVTQAVVWTMADLAQARCGPRGILSTPALFTLLSTIH